MAMHSPSRSDRAKLRQIRRAPRAVGGAANFRAEMARGYPPHIQKAFDELRFGPLRTLNLRDGLPSADEARDRADRWIRTKQVERAGELLVITGRGNNSENGVGRIRQSVLALLPSLRRRNVITGWAEHTPGSFVVSLAPMQGLFEVPRRRREQEPAAVTPPSLEALSPETLSLLRDLAVTYLTTLGIHDFERFIETEMTAKFSALSSALSGDDEDPETELRAAIRHALDELNDLA